MPDVLKRGYCPSAFSLHLVRKGWVPDFRQRRSRPLGALRNTSGWGVQTRSRTSSSSGSMSPAPSVPLTPSGSMMPTIFVISDDTRPSCSLVVHYLIDPEALNI